MANLVAEREVRRQVCILMCMKRIVANTNCFGLGLLVPYLHLYRAAMTTAESWWSWR